MREKQKEVLYDSPEAASFQTVAGWVSRTGVFCGGNEHQARILGSTHFRCSCGEISTGSTCNTCQRRRAAEKHKNRLRGPWDGQMIYSEEGDDVFSNPKDALTYMEDQALDFEGMRFVLCKPHYLSQLDASVWVNDLPDEVELSPAVQEALDKLNAVIAAEPPVSWFPSEIAWNGETK